GCAAAAGCCTGCAAWAAAVRLVVLEGVSSRSKSSHDNMAVTSFYNVLLTGFTVRIIDRAGLRHIRCIRLRIAGDGVEAAVVDGGLLGRRRGQGTQVVGRLETAQPGHTICDIQFLAVGTGNVQVQRLRLVDPLLASACGVDEPARRSE